LWSEVRGLWPLLPGELRELWCACSASKLDAPRVGDGSQSSSQSLEPGTFRADAAIGYALIGIIFVFAVLYCGLCPVVV